MGLLSMKLGFICSNLPGHLQLAVRPAGQWLEMSIRDDGQGVPLTEVECIFFAERQRGHALVAVAPAPARIFWVPVSAGGA